MNTRKLGGGLIGLLVAGLALACDKGNPPLAPSASNSTQSSPNFSRSSGERKMRWDIVTINFSNGNLSAGGIASARANDGSKITLTGSGTFERGDDDEVTGGGSWTIEKTGMPTVTGSYRATALVRFDPAAGTFPAGLVDRIDNAADARAGLVVLQIRYSDGSRGILVVSCELVGTPHDVFEGVTASKGSATFWNREAPPAPPGDANRTVFHVIGRED